MIAEPTAKALDGSGATRDRKLAAGARVESATSLLVRQERRKGRPASGARRLQMHGPAEEPKTAICMVFGTRCSEALRVAQCESRYDLDARNGQYLGLFQMGSWERQTYGHGETAIAQSRAAYRYFVASGRDWSPWECKPWW